MVQDDVIEISRDLSILDSKFSAWHLFVLNSSSNSSWLNQMLGERFFGFWILNGEKKIRFSVEFSNYLLKMAKAAFKLE